MKKIVQIMMIMFLMHGSIKLIAGTYSGGTGTEIDPYQIATAHDLIELSLTPADWGSDISAIYFIQTTDIVFNSDHTQQDWNNNGSVGPAEGFSPIGNNATPFQGTYDGQNYTISNLYISRSSSDDVGLFGSIDNSGSGVKNLGLINVNITGSVDVGGLAGSLLYQNTINNCYSTGNVSGSGTVGGLVGASFNYCTVSNSYSTCSISVSGEYGTAGGLVGNNGSSTISNSHATGNVSGTTYLGGLAGENDGTVINSYSTGGVSGSSDYSCVGGLVGYNSRTISRSYSTGNVSGISYVGGLVGYNNNCKISNSYSLGNVTRSSGANTFFGGFSGYDVFLSAIEYCYSKGKVYESPGIIWVSGQKGFVGESDVSAGSNTYTNNFFDSEVSEQTSGTGATAKTTAQMKTKTTFTDVNWDFVGESTNGENDFWNIFSNINDGYPILSWQYYYLPLVTTQEVSDVVPETATGNGNITDLGYPYPVQHGVCWNTSGSPTIADFKTEEGTVSEVGAFTSNITGLSPFTHYYVRAYATNSEGTSYGDQTDFSTSGIPILTTNEIEGISVNSAISGGNVTNGDPVNEYGVCWSTSPNPTITDAHTVDGTGLGTFESSITGLSKNTHYYLRAYATNSTGTGYGEEKDFITPNQLYNMLDFDGTNDYVSTPITLPNQGTIEFWFKADDITTGFLWRTSADYWYCQLWNGSMYVWIGGSTGGEALIKRVLPLIV